MGRVFPIVVQARPGTDLLPGRYPLLDEDDNPVGHADVTRDPDGHWRGTAEITRAGEACLRDLGIVDADGLVCVWGL